MGEDLGDGGVLALGLPLQGGIATRRQIFYSSVTHLLQLVVYTRSSMGASGKTQAAQRVEKAGAELASSAAYAELLAEVRRRIAVSRARAALSVNRELIELYWQIGREILRRQEERGWGAKVIDQLARDLKEEGHRGFSVRNIQYMRAFAGAWGDRPIVQQAAAQIPWGHNMVLLDKLKDPAIRLWYAERAAVEGWSRNVLEHQIATQLHLRQGKATTNFAGTLPAPDSELAQEMLRDPYDLSFLPGERIAEERDLEEALLADIVKFMLELGGGLTFAGRHKRLEVGGDEFFIDLLFFHVDLLRYVVVELKIGKFKAEYAGKLNFYLNAVDDQIRLPHHRETIGILLCTGRNRQVVEYALRRVESPIGVSTYTVDRTTLTEELPPELEERLPSVEQLSAGLQRIADERAEELAAALDESHDSALPK